jgi:hypothetical protein
MTPVHPNLTPDLAHERQDTLLLEADHDRLVREVRAIRQPSHLGQLLTRMRGAWQTPPSPTGWNHRPAPEPVDEEEDDGPAAA